MDRHEELRKKLDLFPIGLPRAEETMKILRLLFSEEEAGVAAHVPMPPLMFTAERIARKAGVGRKEAAELLAGMGSRNVIMEVDMLGGKLYSLAPAVPGFFEMQFMSGQAIDENRREAGRLWHEALNGPFGEENYGYATSGVRVVPIGKTIDATQTVFNFEELEKIVKSAGSLAVTDCACRKSAGKCGGPLETCIMLGVSADYLVGKGLARRVTKREAMQIFEKCADAGLVATTTNTVQTPGIICNCCKCCCASLQGVVALNKPASSVRSNFCSTPIEGADCKLCKVCVNACPVEALYIADERIAVKEERCIGCGVCVHKCRQNALALTRKSEKRPLETSLHLLAKMVDERGKTEKIIRNIVKDIF
ncbi:MAG: 4Fe-4S binding protein [bacterium]